MKLPCFKKSKEEKNFFDYPAKERKKIIKKATEEANNKQSELIKRYKKSYCKAT